VSEPTPVADVPVPGTTPPVVEPAPGAPPTATLTTSPVPVSGAQVVLERDGYRAELAAVGATLRALTFEGRDLVVPFAADQVRPGFRGALLAPWPNRVTDGRYERDGVELQLALNEVERGHALHGLAHWADWTFDQAQAARASASFVLVPSDGYPWRLALSVVYELGDDGLTTTVTARNVGEGTAPYGTAPHPYLVAGEGRVDDWTFDLPAASYLEVTDDRLVPVGTRPVGDREGFDFREGHAIGDLFVDHAFTDLDFGPADGASADGAPADGTPADGTSADGTSGEAQEARVTATVTARDGHGVTMSWGRELPWVQVHTADRPEPENDRVGLAVEPMTCPPDAFNSGHDLVLLAPGESHAASWTITAF